MTEIIDAIDDWFKSEFSQYNILQFGLCELIKRSAGESKTEQVIPVNVTDRSLKVSLDDRYKIVTWTRWTQPITYEASEDWSFGRSESRFANVPLRMVFGIKQDLGEDIIFDVVNNFPSKFTVAGFQLVFTDGKPAIDPDHETIFTTEFGNVVYEKHRLTWNMYAVNLNIQFIECLQTS
jgi:hypothetical protein